MTHYDYKVVPSPKRVKKVKGVRGTADLFALTLADAINEQARGGWEYLRAEQLPAEEPGGWFRRGTESEQTVLIFRRLRETVGPRLAVAGEAEDGFEAEPMPRAERPLAERLQGGAMRRQPSPRTDLPRSEAPPRAEPIFDRGAAEARVEPRVESRVEPRVESRVEPKIESWIEPRNEPTAEPRTDLRPERRVELRRGDAGPTPLRPMPRLGPADKP